MTSKEITKRKKQAFRELMKKESRTKDKIKGQHKLNIDIKRKGSDGKDA